uniref:Uncharacterized protein n=1 Tax=Panagrolaimus davidi TaxID=227884 RepID=A0A914QUN9_9BILA
MVGNLVFHRFNTYAQTAEKLPNTSVSATLKSMKISNNSAIAKSVYFTRGIQSIDSHFAQNYNHGYSKMSYERDVGIFAHIRNLTYADFKDEKNYNQVKFAV